MYMISQQKNKVQYAKFNAISDKVMLHNTVWDACSSFTSRCSLDTAMQLEHCIS